MICRNVRSCQAKQRHNSEDLNLRQHRCEHLQFRSWPSVREPHVEFLMQGFFFFFPSHRQIPKSLCRMSARLAVTHLLQRLCGRPASIEAFILQRKPSDFDFTSFFVRCFGNVNKLEKRSWVMKPKQHYDYVNMLLSSRDLWPAGEFRNQSRLRPVLLHVDRRYVHWRRLLRVLPCTSTTLTLQRSLVHIFTTCLCLQRLFMVVMLRGTDSDFLRMQH